MIQYISTAEKAKKMNGNNIKCSPISNPQALDEFEVNVIDLNDEDIWRNSELNTQKVNMISDFRNLNKMIENSNKNKILIIYPQNLIFKYDFDRYQYEVEIKNCLSDISTIISSLTGVYFSLLFETTKTEIGNFVIDASFHFQVNKPNLEPNEIGILSKKSEKLTVIENEPMSFTTLNIENYDQLMSLLRRIGFLIDKTPVPDWLEGLERFNDKELKLEIENYNAEIINLKNKRKNAESDIDKNNEFKSILYTNGEELVDVIFKILGEILGFQSSQFEDLKKEDFLIRLEDVTFIGEIKGIGANVKSANVSQIDNHYQDYLEKLSEKGVVENVKSLLIINHQRNKPLEQREEVHQTQIDLAIRNKSLIIETNTLLLIFEKFLLNELTQTEIIKMFSEETGLLKLKT